MGKKKFIQKQDSATLKMVYRPSDHIQTNQQNQDKPIFQVVQRHYRKKEKEEKMVNLAELIEKKLNEGDYTTGDYKKKPIKSKKKQEHPDIPSDIANKLKSRDDLWINQLNKMRQQQDNVDEDEEWEDVTESEDEDDELKQYKKVQFHPSIKLRKFDENGLPLDDGYDYSQHIHVVGQVQQGDVVIEHYVKPTEMHHITEDIDYQEEEMTEEQKEVFEALKYEGEQPIYEELEDDFVMLANGGEQIIIQNNNKQQQQQDPDGDEPSDYEEDEEDHIGEDQMGEDCIDEDEIDEEDEIPYSKHKQHQDSESEEYDVDSEDEREFEREMKAFDQGQIEEIHNPKTQTNAQSFNQIIEDHILAMKKQKIKRQKDSDEERDYQAEKRERELYFLKSKDYMAYLKEKYPNTDPNEFHLPKEIPKLTLEEDKALQQYFKMMEEGKEDQVIDDQLNRPYKPDFETIVQTTIEQSTLSKINPEQLNIIKWIASGKHQNSRKQKLSRKEQNQIIKQDKEKRHEQQVEKLQKLNRERDETKEEKKQRKELIKQLKQEKKDKKKAFKETFKIVNKQLSKQNIANKEATNIGGVIQVQ